MFSRRTECLQVSCYQLLAPSSLMPFSHQNPPNLLPLQLCPLYSPLQLVYISNSFPPANPPRPFLGSALLMVMNKVCLAKPLPNPQACSDSLLTGFDSYSLLLLLQTPSSPGSRTPVTLLLPFILCKSTYVTPVSGAAVISQVT